MPFAPLSHCRALACGAFLAAAAFAQAPAVDIPAPSPASTLKQRVGLTDIEIVYARPGVKGRKIFGGLEPFGSIWRVGANNATTISFSTAVNFGGKDVPAGKYALFALLGREEWTVILSSANQQWGSYRYDPKDDVARVAAPVVNLGSTIVETFVIDVNHIRDDSAVLNLVWESTLVSVPLKFDVVTKVQAQIEAVMASSAEKKPYVPAAMFYYEHKLDLKKAAQWMDLGIAAQAENFRFPFVYRKALILSAAGDKAGARAAAEASLAGARKAQGSLKDEYVRLNEALLASLQ
ncbi:MAG: DUF2911 domain-containing protein [Opitutaceae bacterium]|nr:DUF2911 domain-containing protein [Opitutaceae bacterium]